MAKCKSKSPADEVNYDPRYIHLKYVANHVEECVHPEGHEGPHASALGVWINRPAPPAPAGK